MENIPKSGEERDQKGQEGREEGRTGYQMVRGTAGWEPV